MGAVPGYIMFRMVNQTDILKVTLQILLWKQNSHNRLKELIFYLFSSIAVPTPYHGNKIPTSSCRNFIPIPLSGNEIPTKWRGNEIPTNHSWELYTIYNPAARLVAGGGLVADGWLAGSAENSANLSLS